MLPVVLCDGVIAEESSSVVWILVMVNELEAREQRRG